MGVFSPFIDLATALGQKVGTMFVKQGVETPVQKAVSTNGDSFDFAAGIQKLISPVTNLFDPRVKAGVSMLEGATKVGDEIFNSVGRNVGSFIDNLFGNGNKAPDKNAVQTTNVTAGESSFASQLQSLGDAFKLFTNIQSGNPSVNNSQTSLAGSNNTVLIIGGVVALAAVMLLTRRAK